MDFLYYLFNLILQFICKYFGMSKGFFLRLQMDLDLLEAEDTEGLQADLKNIRCITNSCTAD